MAAAGGAAGRLWCWQRVEAAHPTHDVPWPLCWRTWRVFSLEMRLEISGSTSLSAPSNWNSFLSLPGDVTERRATRRKGGGVSGGEKLAPTVPSAPCMCRRQGAELTSSGGGMRDGLGSHGAAGSLAAGAGAGQALLQHGLHRQVEVCTARRARALDSPKK